MLAVNFIDGSCPKIVQEPEMRIKDILSESNQIYLRSDSFYIHLVYLTSTARWWTNTLNSIQVQLIAYVGIDLIH